MAMFGTCADGGWLAGTVHLTIMKKLLLGGFWMVGLVLAQDGRSLVTDEPLVPRGKPEGAVEYVAKAAPGAGQHLALTLKKLEQGFDPPRPFVIWAIGSSYTNMLGNGEMWQEEVARRFPKAPPIEYRKMVGNSCPWQYVRGWARHLVIPDQPDLVITYTNGDPADLERLIQELQAHTTADIIVPSLHWRERDEPLWGKSENALDQDVGRVRAICAQYGVEFVENRQAWAEYLKANGLPISALLKDAVHQSDYGASIINRNILAHLQKPERFSYDPNEREWRVPAERQADGRYQVSFEGHRIDLIGRKSAAGGRLRVLIDGRPAEEEEVFLMSYVQPDGKNAKEGKGAQPRDQAPHGITLGVGVVPQSWTLVMTSDAGDYEIVGSVTGADGGGNAFERSESRSGQLVIEPELWRRAERNRAGDRFTFEVKRAVVAEVDFKGEAGERFVLRLVQGLGKGEHRVELVPEGEGEAEVEAFEVFRPTGWGH
jgi:hypothetical protein